MQAAKKNTTHARRTSKSNSKAKLRVCQPPTDNERARRDLEAERIMHPPTAATVKQCLDVVRAAAVLLDNAAQHPSETQLVALAGSVSDSLSATADVLDKVDTAPEMQKSAYHHSDMDAALYHLAAIVKGAGSMLAGASEAIMDESEPPLARAVATALREAADYYELRLVGTAGTLAASSRCPHVLAFVLQEELDRIRQQEQKREEAQAFLNSTAPAAVSPGAQPATATA